MVKRIGCAFTVMLVIVFVVAACSGGDTPVPDVFGRTLDQARSDLEMAGLRLGDVRYDVNAAGATGRVIDQHPAPEVRVGDGRRVSITISGPELVRVPYVVGDRIDSARSAVSAARLDRGPITYVYDDRIPAGTVLRQDPPAGRWVARDSSVAFTVSNGPETTNVPGVTGLQEDDARRFIYDLGLRPYVVEEYDRNAQGYVLQQYPSVRTEVELGETVELVVSAGPEPVIVPDVRGMRQRDAERALRRAGLEISYAESDADPESGERYVYSQSPYPGAVLPTGSGVVLRIRVVK